MKHCDVTLDDGRQVRVHDTGPAGDGPVVLWHHGTPQTGALIAPVAAPALERGMRMICVTRPGYPGVAPQPGRTVATSAADAVAVAALLGVERFVTAGASGGGAFAVATAALAPYRVAGVATLAGIAPRRAEWDWLGAMAAPGALSAAMHGRQARIQWSHEHEFDPHSFTDADWQALAGAWGPLGADSQAASAQGKLGEVDDDVAYVNPWGIDLGAIAAPVLVVQGTDDRVVPLSHGQALAQAMPTSRLDIKDGAGHISVLAAWPAVLDWLSRAL